MRRAACRSRPRGAVVQRRTRGPPIARTRSLPPLRHQVRAECRGRSRAAAGPQPARASGRPHQASRIRVGAAATSTLSTSIAAEWPQSRAQGVKLQPLRALSVPFPCPCEGRSRATSGELRSAKATGIGPLTWENAQKRPPEADSLRVGDTGIEPVTSSVSGKRAPAAPIARVVQLSGGAGRRRGGDGI